MASTGFGWEYFTSGECTAGGQLGTFKGRAPIHEKGTRKLFKEEMARGLARIISLRSVKSFNTAEADFPLRKFIHKMTAESKRTSLQW